MGMHHVNAANSTAFMLASLLINLTSPTQATEPKSVASVERHHSILASVNYTVPVSDEFDLLSVRLERVRLRSYDPREMAIWATTEYEDGLTKVDTILGFDSYRTWFCSRYVGHDVTVEGCNDCNNYALFRATEIVFHTEAIYVSMTRRWNVPSVELPRNSWLFDNSCKRAMVPRQPMHRHRGNGEIKVTLRLVATSEHPPPTKMQHLFEQAGFIATPPRLLNNRKWTSFGKPVILNV